MWIAGEKAGAANGEKHNAGHEQGQGSTFQHQYQGKVRDDGDEGLLQGVLEDAAGTASAGLGGPNAEPRMSAAECSRMRDTMRIPIITHATKAKLAPAQNLGLNARSAAAKTANCRPSRWAAPKPTAHRTNAAAAPG